MKGSRFSWMALVAATTLGPNAMAGTLRAQVRADLPLAGGSLAQDKTYRLVVQSYDGGAIEAFASSAKPVASTQLAVTGRELAKGVDVDLVEIRSAEKQSNDTVVVAWIETGKADLEFDGREARPTDASVVGQVRANGAYAAVTLKEPASFSARASRSESREPVARNRAPRDRSALRRQTARRDKRS